MHGDEVEIRHPTDTIHEIQEVRDNDRVKIDGTYQVDESGKI
jgi:hypothetical protein